MRPALLGLLALAFTAAPVAALPPDAVIVISAATVDAGELPGLLVLDSGPAATFEIAAPLAAVPHDPGDLLLYDAASGQARVLDGDAPMPSGQTVRYHDPDGAGSTLPALILTLVSNPFSESSISLADGRSDTMANLLTTPGSVVSYAPEPAGAVALATGAALLFALRGRRAGREKIR